MSVKEYLRRRDALHYTTFIINERGGFYLHEGRLIAAKEFEKAHETPVSLVTTRGRGVNPKNEPLPTSI